MQNKKTLQEISDQIKDKMDEAGLSVTSSEVDDEDPTCVLLIYNTDDEWVDEYGNDDEEAEKKATDKLKEILAQIDLSQIWDEYEERNIDYEVSVVRYEGDSYEIFLDEK